MGGAVSFASVLEPMGTATCVTCSLASPASLVSPASLASQKFSSAAEPAAEDSHLSERSGAGRLSIDRAEPSSAVQA
jgi:hypothetical protein